MIKKMMTLFFCALSILLLSSAALPAATSVPVINADVLLDGSILDVKAEVRGQSVYLPVRAVCEALGYAVSWSEKSGVKTVSVSKTGDAVELNLTYQQVTENGHQFDAGVYSGAGVQLVASRTYIDSGLFSTVFAANSFYDSKTNQVALQKRCENNIMIMTGKIPSEKAHLKATIQYPQLSGLPDAGVQKNINTILKQSAQNALNEGQKNADEMAQAIKDGYTGAVGMCETYYDYVTAYNQNGLFSVVLTDYQYAGGAHGGSVQRSYTFDLATGSMLKLSDLMDSGADENGRINTLIRNEIDRRVAVGDLSEFEFSKFKDIGINPEFYLTNNAVVFYFQEYSYFPYAAGIQEFSVTYADLSDMLKAEFGFLYRAPVQLNPKTVTTLSVGDIGQVILQGNVTTGYTWHYTLSGDGVLAPASDCSSITAPKDIVGAGGTYTWNFKALKAGESAITFKYYRDWEGESSATPENTLVYQVKVQ